MTGSNTFAYLGIDPGVHGAAAIIFSDGFSIHDYSTPTRSAEVVKTWLTESTIKLCCLEKINIYPRKDKKRQILRSHQMINKLPALAGEWRGILCAVGIEFIEVLPQRWQKILPPMRGADSKTRARKAALQFFPAAEKYLKHKKDHNRADALCLARYAQMVSNG